MRNTESTNKAAINSNSQPESCPSASSSHEICEELSKESGIGTIRNIRLLTGIDIYILNYRYFKSRYYKSHISTTDNTPPILGFGFCLSGKTHFKQNCLKQEFVISGNQSAFYYFSDRRHSYTVSPDESVLTVGIQIEPDFFRTLMEEEQHFQSTPLRRLVEKNHWDSFRQVNIVTPSMRSVLQQMIDCPHQGILRRLFYETKTMELIYCKLMLLESIQGTQVKPSVLKSRDIDRIHEAGNLLTKDLQNPPGLVELSRSVGLSRTQLLKDFPKIFGTSPYGYLRDIRLKKAGELLSGGEQNITEIAYSVGYSSSSHFTKVFKQYFGTTPSRYP